MPAQIEQPASGGVFDARDFGACGDGKTLDTQAIQRAVDACARAGGGRVILAGGRFLSGTIQLRSHVLLEVVVGTTLLGSSNLSDYPEFMGEIIWLRHGHVTRSLIVGENLEGAGLIGGGIIDGQGSAFFVSLEEMERLPEREKDRNRPFLIRFIGCRDVRVEGLRLRNSAMWMQHYLGCERVSIRGLHVSNFCNHNNDSIDLDGCRQVTVSDCIFESGDDAITLKSTCERPSEQITISSCLVRTYANGIKFGTESSGGFRDVAISNCVVCGLDGQPPFFGLRRTYCGLALEVVDGGTLERVAISNLTMRGVDVPIFFRLGNRGRPYRQDQDPVKVGQFRDVSVNNLIATGASRTGCSITGIPEACIEEISLSNVQLEFSGGGERALSDRTVDEKSKVYPESSMFGDLPAYGLFCRHVRHLRLSNIRMRTATPDLRHALVCEDVEHLRIDGLQADLASGAAPSVRTGLRGKHTQPP